MHTPSIITALINQPRYCLQMNAPVERGVPTPLHKSPPPIHCCDKPRPLRRARIRVMRRGQGGRRDTAREHYLGLIFSAGGSGRGHRQGHLAQGHPSPWVPLVQASLGRSPLHPPSQGHRVPKPPTPASSRAVPALPLGAQGTRTRRTRTPPCIHTRAHSCTPHIQPMSRGGGGHPRV